MLKGRARMLRWWVASVLVTYVVGVALLGAARAAPAPPPVLRLDFLSFSSKLHPPVDRLEVRQAIAHAVDRQAIARLFSTAIPAVGINHPKLPGQNPQLRGLAYDPARAKALLAQANWSADSALKIYISTSPGYTGPAWDAVRSRILEDLRTVGIKAEFAPVPFNTILGLMDAGAGATYLIAIGSDPSDFGYPYFSVWLLNRWKYGEAAQDLITRFLQSTDPAQKEKVAQEIEQYLLDQAFIIPLFFRG